MLEQAREVVRDFNRIYDTDTLVEPELMLPPKGQGRLVGIDGRGKMSKSLNNGIYLSDSAEEIEKSHANVYRSKSYSY